MTGADDRLYMEMALELAAAAAAAGEVPVGAVVVRDGEVLGRGWNRPISTCDATAHAEIVALREASRACGNYRLPEATLYVTIEPCVMCAGAAYWTQLKRVVYGAADSKRGFTSVNHSLLHPKTEVTGGVLKEECAELIQSFFRNKRL